MIISSSEKKIKATYVQWEYEKYSIFIMSVFHLAE